MKVIFRIGLVIHSLLPLSIIMVIQNLDLKIFKNSEHKNFIDIFRINLVAILFIIFILIAINVIFVLRIFETRGMEKSETIKDISLSNENNLLFYMTYILPFMVMDLSNIRGILIFSFVMIMLLYLLYKSEVYYANPVLLICGYNVYKINTNIRENVYIIIRGNLQKGDTIKFRYISNPSVYHAIKARN